MYDLLLHNIFGTYISEMLIKHMDFILKKYVFMIIKNRSGMKRYAIFTPLHFNTCTITEAVKRLKFHKLQTGAKRGGQQFKLKILPAFVNLFQIHDVSFSLCRFSFI